MADPDPTVLTEQECWALLRSQELGRLAWADDREATILPINYAVDEGALVFRTGPGSKLEAVVSDRELVFEVDRLEGEVARSVLVRGRGHVLPASEEARIDQVGLRAWLGDARPVLVSIAPTAISGRRYELRRPWTSMRR